MTSTADPTPRIEPRRRTGAGLLGILGLVLLGQLLTPEPWTYLWPVLPVAGAAALLLAQTGVAAVGWLPPAACLAWLLLGGMADEPWAWCLAAGVLAAALLGAAERRGLKPAQRTWAYLPALALAALFPLAPAYPETVEAVVRAIQASEAEQLVHWRSLGLPADQRLGIEQVVTLATALEIGIVRHLLPAILFVWVALLVNLAERMARRLADLVRQPLAEGTPLAAWRLPDGAVWCLVAGLALVATRDARLLPVGLNLSVSVGLAFGVQGLAVLRSFLLSYGMTPGLIAVLFVFTSLTMGPILPLTATGVGLMDLWLDFRRLDPRPEPEEPEGGKRWK